MDDYICPIMSRPVRWCPPGHTQDCVELYEVKCMKEKCTCWVKAHWICKETPLARYIEGCCGLMNG
jgi:hypothetical protein